MINKLVASLCLMAFAFLGNAQSDDYPNTITAGIGFSLVGGFIDLLDSDNFELSDVDNVENASDFSGSFAGSSRPAFQVAYDRRIVNWFSLGAGLSLQPMDFTLTDFSYFDEDDQQQRNIGTGTVEINRFNVALRAFFHYGNKGRMDLYSGFRVGLTSWGLNFSGANPDFEQGVEDFSLFGVNPAIQIVPFALRGYVTEDIGLNVEFAIGAPHFMAIGVNYRLP